MSLKTKSTIESRDISVVIQGPIVSYKKTRKLIINIRKTLPNSQIILSTWRYERNLNKIKALNELIQSKIPKEIQLPVDSGVKNVERQIVSTLNGLKKAKKLYCLKLRTDMVLIKKPKLIIQKNTSTLKGKILIPAEYTRDPELAANFKFHFSDILQFGYTSDLLKIWLSAKKINLPKIEKKLKGVVYSEQLVYLPYFKPHVIRGLKMKEISKLKDAEKVLVDNFIVYPMQRIGFKSEKLPTSFINVFSCYTTLSFYLARKSFSSSMITSVVAKSILWIMRKVLKRIDDVVKPKIFGLR